ncbi:hypothetical protein C8R47DRAFT_1078526 [Mycena vitilis]|nr:hypothetical protein C8R47DRAFT_1078526 [Mycena vitilis]
MPTTRTTTGLHRSRRLRSLSPVPVPVPRSQPSISKRTPKRPQQTSQKAKHTSQPQAPPTPAEEVPRWTPPPFTEPHEIWFLNRKGQMSIRYSPPHRHVVDLHGAPNGQDQSKFPVWAAAKTTGIEKFLPRCSHLRHLYKKRERAWRHWEWEGDPEATITAFRHLSTITDSPYLVLRKWVFSFLLPRLREKSPDERIPLAVPDGNQECWHVTRVLELCIRVGVHMALGVRSAVSRRARRGGRGRQGGHGVSKNGRNSAVAVEDRGRARGNVQVHVDGAWLVKGAILRIGFHLQLYFGADNLRFKCVQLHTVEMGAFAADVVVEESVIQVRVGSNCDIGEFNHNTVHLLAEIALM